MANSELKLTVPEGAVRDIVLQEVVKSMGDPAEMVTAFVREILAEPVTSGKSFDYDKKSRIERWVASALKKLVEELIAELLEQKKDEMRKALQASLTTKKFVTSMTDALISSVGSSQYRASVHLNLTRD